MAHTRTGRRKAPRTPSKKAAPVVPTCPGCGDPHYPVPQRCDRHNGWTNYETWAVNLWMSNDEESSDAWVSEAAKALEEAANFSRPIFPDSFTRAERATLILAERLKEDHEDRAHESGANADNPTFATDLLNAALSMVNWQEIAKHLVDAAIEAEVVTP